MALRHEYHSSCVQKQQKCGVSLSNKLLVIKWKAASQAADIRLEAHMYFVDFTEGHCQPWSPNDFPEVSPLINYDLVCLTAKMRRDTNKPWYHFVQTHLEDLSPSL